MSQADTGSANSSGIVDPSDDSLNNVTQVILEKITTNCVEAVS